MGVALRQRTEQNAAEATRSSENNEVNNKVMKTTRMLALINVLAALTGSAVLAQPAPEDRPGQQGPPQESLRPNRPNPEVRRQALLEKYDANKDGKLDDSELTSIGRDVEQGKLEPRLLGVGPRGGGMGPGPRFRGGRGPIAPETA